MQQTLPDMSDALQQVACIDQLPTLLQMLSDVTGLGFIGIARVTESSWTACAVHDAIEFGIKVGTQLDIAITFCAEVRRSGKPIVIDHASADPQYREHLIPKILGFESLVTVPIITADGEYFGALFGVDRRPRTVSAPWVVTLFSIAAQLVALQLDDVQRQRNEIGTNLNRSFMDALVMDALAADLCNPADALYPASKELADSVKRRARRLAVLTDPMQDFLSPDLGAGVALQVEQSVDLDPLLNGIVADLRFAHPQRRIIANIAVGSAISCDPQRIAQLVFNLLEAALSQAAPSGPVSVAALLENSGLSIDVWNAGEPIPIERVARLFASAWRPSPENPPIDSVSLHVCRLIVDAHDGFISVISNIAHGTQFSVWIPVPTASVAAISAVRRWAVNTGDVQTSE